MAESKDSNLLGKRLRSLRAEHGWTLADVSRKTGISAGTLSKLENGQTSLNFTSVNKLAQGLGLPVSAMTNPVPLPSSGMARRSLTRLGGGIRFETPDVDYEILCNDLSDQNHAYMQVVIKAHEVDELKEFRRHPGQEFLYVLEGKIELHTESYQPTLLDKGDSIMFDSSMGHKYVSKGEGDAVALIGMSLSEYVDVTDTLEVINNK